MKLRKKTIDNGVRYVSRDDHSHTEQSQRISKERDIKPTTRKKDASNNIKISQRDSIKFNRKITTGERFRLLKRIITC